MALSSASCCSSLATVPRRGLGGAATTVETGTVTGGGTGARLTSTKVVGGETFGTLLVVAATGAGGGV